MPPENTNENVTENEATQEQPQEELTYEAWFESLDEGTQTMIEGHIHGLKGALDSEREQREGLASELRRLTTKYTEEGSEARSEMEKLSAAVEAANKKAAFYEALSGAGCTNLRLAWLAAQDMDAFTRKGEPDVAALKEAMPQLFAQKRMPPGNAGEGTNGTAPREDFNSAIRRAAGRR